MSNYELRKEAARNEAIEWQDGFEDADYDWYDMAVFGAYFVEHLRPALE